MIIQALYERYGKLATDPDSGISPLYFSSGKVSYVLVINRSGTLVSVVSAKITKGKKEVPQIITVPEQPSRASAVTPYFLMDKAEYILGHYSLSDNESQRSKKQADAWRKHEAGAELARQVLADVKTDEAVAILGFYEQWSQEDAREHYLLRDILADLDKGLDTNMAFRLEGSDKLIHEAPAIRAAWIDHRIRVEGLFEYNQQCLITGEPEAPIARTHEKVKGVRNAQSAGASLVSFNFPAVISYGKDQSYNAPVSKMAVFGYTTALNHLLASDNNRLFIGDMTIVFWAEETAKKEEIEPLFAAFFDPKHPSLAASDIEPKIKDIIKRLRNGTPLGSDVISDTDQPFYVLGLSPNNARVAVRFFWNGKAGDMIAKLALHASDLALGGQASFEDEIPSIFRMLNETMRVGSDMKKVGDPPPARLGGEMLRSVLQGTAYPYSLYMAIINRIRADGIVNRLRASILKAYLVRYYRIHSKDNEGEELLMGLNYEAKEPAYRLGRLFAVLEKAQQDAQGRGINATIKDRYFNAASSTPASVFPILMKLSNHHQGKSRYGGIREQEIQEIVNELEVFPTHLDLQQQGKFILGYYHQNQAYFEAMKAANDAKKQAAAAVEHNTDQVIE